MDSKQASLFNLYFYSVGSGSTGNGYLVYNSIASVAFDAGFKPSEFPEGTPLPSCVFVSHFHLDHVKNLDAFTKLGIPTIYGVGSGLAHIDAYGYMTGGTFVVEPIGISYYGFELQHDIENFGYYIKFYNHEICYITDTYKIPFYFLNIDTLIVECNFVDEILWANAAKNSSKEDVYIRTADTHLGLKKLTEWLKFQEKTSPIKNVILTHLSATNADEKIILEEVRKCTGAQVHIAGRNTLVKLIV